jgi:peptidoglycan/LPS O-acetylase OafA/YrhL
VKNAPENNFDFLRLFAALSVLASHQYALSGMSEPYLLYDQSLGDIGVFIFFSISGYLITESWIGDPSIIRFAVKRFLRIWPGLLVVTIFAAVIIGPIATTLPLTEYFRSLHLKIALTLPGVFTKNPFPVVVNGSLWTIPYEVNCYAVLAVAGAARLLNRRWIVLTATIGLAVYYFGFLHAERITTLDYLMKFGLFFLSGTCLQVFRRWREDGLLAAPIAIAVLAALAFNSTFLVYWLLIPFAAVSIGAASTPFLRRAGRFGDLSYGIYIYAFPVQQTIWFATHGRFSFITCLIMSSISTVALAFASWHLIEAPALRLKPRARKTTEAVADTFSCFS